MISKTTRDEAIRRYLRGEPAILLAKELGVSEAIIYRWKKQHAIGHFDKREHLLAEQEKQREKAINLFNSGVSANEIATLFSVNPVTVYYWVNNAVAKRPTKIHNKRHNESTRIEALRRYNAGEPAEKISAEMGVSKSAIHKWFKKK